MGFQQKLGFFVVKREKNRPKKMIIGICEFVFWPKMAVHDAQLFFKTCFAETPFL